MNNFKLYQIVLGAVPFVLILLGGYFADALPKRSFFVKTLDKLSERDLRKLLDRAGLTKTSNIAFIGLRIIFALVTTVIIYFIQSGSFKERMIVCAISFYGMYKLLYFYLILKEKDRIAKLNKELPYTIKAISYLCYLYPVTNAFQRSVNYVSKTFREDITELLYDIEEDPLTFKPYQKWIDKYEGKLNMLDVYLHNLYRMGHSTSKEQEKLLSSLNSSISAETRRVRLSKNDTINHSVAWFGMAPVAYLTVMLVFMLVIITSAL